LNITLPEATVRLIDRVAKKGHRFIAEAVERYITEIGRANLKKQLKEGALRRAERDLAIAGEWFGIEDEAGLDGVGCRRRVTRNAFVDPFLALKQAFSDGYMGGEELERIRTRGRIPEWFDPVSRLDCACFQKGSLPLRL
jgi:CopG family transcriptional regulator/antitoxin EndoAI